MGVYLLGYSLATCPGGLHSDYSELSGIKWLLLQQEFSVKFL